MGQSTDGQICFGVAFEEDFEFPWSEEKFDSDIETWWREVGDFEPTFYPYTDGGEYKPGVVEADPRVNQYYNERDRWDKKNPKIPVEEINTCHGDYPMWILAVPGTGQSASRGCPEKFDPTKLVVDPVKFKKFAEFLKKYNIECEDEPSWYLSSYWG